MAVFELIRWTVNSINRIKTMAYNGNVKLNIHNSIIRKIRLNGVLKRKYLFANGTVDVVGELGMDGRGRGKIRVVLNRRKSRFDAVVVVVVVNVVVIVVVNNSISPEPSMVSELKFLS